MIKKCNSINFSAAREYILYNQQRHVIAFIPFKILTWNNQNIERFHNYLMSVECLKQSEGLDASYHTVDKRSFISSNFNNII